MRQDDLQQLRSTTMELLSDPRIDDLWTYLANSTIQHEKAGRPGPVLRQVFLRGLSLARMRHVEPEECQLAELQAVSFEGNLASPFPHGLVLFDEPVTMLRVAGNAEVGEVRVDMSGLLWTDVLARDNRHYVGVYALKDEVLMPAMVEFRPYGQRLRAGAEGQSLLANFLPACWATESDWVAPPG
ncbi:hypothetical protein AB0D56_09920 [Streptomyces sp. NPDC048209]|jgi:hypothetical protein|uniref:hypothetical protein n=1 Tax=Streptomyces sp. NPDC048209 TaxID=3156689 RepID=UPI0034264C5F